MLTFIHVADIHFGMENYGKIEPKSGIHTRLLDFERALNACIDYAIAHNVDFFLFAGDAYKTAHPTPTQQKLFMRCFLRLYKAGIPVIIVIGNHDHPLSFGKAHSLDLFGELPVDGFHLFASPRAMRLETKSGPVQIVGIPWPTRNTISMTEGYQLKSAAHITQYIAQGVDAIIGDLARQLDPQIPAVLAGHLTVSNGIFSGSERRAIYGSDPILLPSQLAREPFDYVALGHLHRYQNVNPGGYPPVIYAGSIERIDFGERKEEKGFCVVKLEKKGVTTHEFIKVPIRPFVQIELVLKEGVSHTQQILDALARHDIVDAVVKILYHVPAHERDMVDNAAVQQACAQAMYVVGVIPLRKPVIRERRTALNVHMDLASLLNAYFSTRTELAEKKERLIEKTLELARECKAQENEEEV